VTVEGCAGGGGRVDNAVLGLVDVVWASDATAPRDRLLVQDGFLRAYPPAIMSSWVTTAQGMLDRAPCSLEFRFVVAMAGVLGLSVDLLRWTPEELATARSMIALYRELRLVLHNGEVYRHSAPSLQGYALEYAGGAELDGRIVVLAYDSSRERTGPDPIPEQSIPPVTRIRLASADPARHYRLRSDGALHSGAALRSAGILVPWAVAADADVLVFDRVD
jgi:alpha-galactosidase